MGLAAAVGIAEVAFSVSAIMSSVAIVGAVVSVAGIITKNKTLSMIGMGLGLVGGIGALASSAGVFGAEIATSAADTAAVAGSSSASAAFEGAGVVAPDAIGSLSGTGATAAFDAGDAAIAGASPAVSTATAGTGTALDAAGTGTAAGQVPTAAADVPSEMRYAFNTAPAPDPLNPSAAINPSGGAPTGAINTSGAAGAPDAALPTPPVTPNNLGAVDPTTGETITSAVDPTTGKIATIPEGDSGTGSGLLGKLVTYVGKNPVVAFGALQAGSSLLSGWTSTLTPAQVAQLNAQAASNQAAANFQNQQTANLQQPKAVASTSPVTGVPQSLIPPGSSPGFINNQAQHLVTGKVA